MSIKIRKTAALVAVESVYAQDAVPALADAVQLSDVTIRPLAATAIDRKLVHPYMAAEEKVETLVHRAATFSVEIAGPGTSGVEPGYAPLLKACGMVASPVADRVDYLPTSSAFDSATIYLHTDRQRRRMLGARGNVKMAFTAGQIPMFTFDMVGLWSAAGTETLPIVNHGARHAKPHHVSKANTPTFQFLGIDPVMQSLEINLGQDAQYDNLVNQEGVDIFDRAVTGSIVFEWPDLPVDPETVAVDGTLAALKLVHGHGLARTIEINAPSVQLVDPQFQDRKGRLMCQAQLVFLPSQAGNDELVLTVR